MRYFTAGQSYAPQISEFTLRCIFITVAFCLRFRVSYLTTKLSILIRNSSHKVKVMSQLWFVFLNSTGLTANYILFCLFTTVLVMLPVVQPIIPYGLRYDVYCRHFLCTRMFLLVVCRYFYFVTMLISVMILLISRERYVGDSGPLHVVLEIIQVFISTRYMEITQHIQLWCLLNSS